MEENGTEENSHKRTFFGCTYNMKLIFTKEDYFKMIPLYKPTLLLHIDELCLALHLFPSRICTKQKLEIDLAVIDDVTFVKECY